jgi:hypothetical protein
MALHLTGSINISGSISGSVSGSFQGDGSKLTGGTNPTTGNMPLNISGAFVDSVITQVAGAAPIISTFIPNGFNSPDAQANVAASTVSITDPSTPLAMVGDTVAFSDDFNIRVFGFGGTGGGGGLFGSAVGVTGTVTDVTGNVITINSSVAPVSNFGNNVTISNGSATISRVGNDVAIVSSDLTVSGSIDIHSGSITVSGSIDIHSGSITVTPSIVNQLTASYALTASYVSSSNVDGGATINPTAATIPIANAAGDAFIDSVITQTLDIPGTLISYTDGTQTGVGFGQSGAGNFYISITDAAVYANVVVGDTYGNGGNFYGVVELISATNEVRLANVDGTFYNSNADINNFRPVLLATLAQSTDYTVGAPGVAGGDVTLDGNLTITGNVTGDLTGSSSEVALTEAGIGSAGGDYTFRIADSGDTGTANTITFVRE